MSIKVNSFKDEEYLRQKLKKLMEENENLLSIKNQVLSKSATSSNTIIGKVESQLKPKILKQTKRRKKVARAAGTSKEQVLKTANSVSLKTEKSLLNTTKPAAPVQTPVVASVGLKLNKSQKSLANSSKTAAAQPTTKRQTEDPAPSVSLKPEKSQKSLPKAKLVPAQPPIKRQAEDQAESVGLKLEKSHKSLLKTNKQAAAQLPLKRQAEEPATIVNLKSNKSQKSLVNGIKPAAATQPPLKKQAEEQANNVGLKSEKSQKSLVNANKPIPAQPPLKRQAEEPAVAAKKPKVATKQDKSGLANATAVPKTANGIPEKAAASSKPAFVKKEVKAHKLLSTSSSSDIPEPPKVEPKKAPAAPKKAATKKVPTAPKKVAPVAENKAAPVAAVKPVQPPTENKVKPKKQQKPLNNSTATKAASSKTTPTKQINKKKLNMKGFFGKRDFEAYAVPTTTRRGGLPAYPDYPKYSDLMKELLNDEASTDDDEYVDLDDDELLMFGDSGDSGDDSDYTDSDTDSMLDSHDNDDDVVDFSDNSSLGTDSDIDIFDSDNDTDYKLPKQEVEDLIVHRGTAQTHPLEPEQNKLFEDSDHKSKLVELDTSDPIIKPIEQPKEYTKEALIKLAQQAITIMERTEAEHEDEIANDPLIAEDCPELVPITENKDNCESDSDSDSSQESIDINTKYTYKFDDDYFVDADKPFMPKKMPISVVDASQCSFSINSTRNLLEYLEMKAKIQTPIVDINKNCSIYRVELVNEPEILTIPENTESADIEENSKTLTIAQSTDSADKEENSKLLTMPPSTDSEDKEDENNKSDECIESAQSSALEENSSLGAAISSSTSGQNRLSEPVESETIAEEFIEENPNESFRTVFYNSIDSYNVLAFVRDPFYVYGTIKLELLAGAIEVYGHTPMPGKSLQIFSPRGCCVVQIATSNSPSTRKQSSSTTLEEVLSKWEKHFSCKDLQHLQENYNAATDAVVLLQRNVAAKKLVQNFRKFMSENVFPNMQNIQKERTFGASEHLLQCIINTGTDKGLRIPPEWQEIPVKENSKIMLVGGKSVGKSTLLRYLVNRHLPKYKRFLLIDLDIGQPEIFIPQTISYKVLDQPLLGPGFFLNEQADKSYVVGHANVIMCPHVYVKCVEQLIADCNANEEFKKMPWVINTMGYNKGFATELLSRIATALQLTDIIQLQSTKEINNFSEPLKPEVLMAAEQLLFVNSKGNESEKVNESESGKQLSYRLHVLETAKLKETRYQQDWAMSAKDMRYAMILSRLSVALRGNSEWLTECRPFNTTLSSLKFVNTVTENQNRAELLEAMEANMVYLCHYVNADAPLQCLGIGVVRAIDYHIDQIYLLPAMPLNEMKNVNCLAIGEMPLPTAMFINQGPKIKNNIPFVYNTKSENATKAIKQIYHRPAEFLAGVHKAQI